MKLQRPTSLTNFGISFLLDKHATEFIPYSYSPSATHNQLTPDQINELPRKIELLYHKQQQSVHQYLAAGLYFSLLFALRTARYSYCYQSACVKMSRVALIGIGITACIAYFPDWKTERKVKDLIEQENQALAEKGLRWYLPKNSQTLELHTDYKFYKAKPSIQDHQAPLKDEKMFINPPAINDEEEVGRKTQGFFGYSRTLF